jgi:hypothetical protein
MKNGDLKRNNATYRLWAGNAQGRNRGDTIAMHRIYETFKLTSRHRLRIEDVRYTMEAKDLRKLDAQQNWGGRDMRVGCLRENDEQDNDDEDDEDAEDAEDDEDDEDEEAEDED